MLAQGPKASPGREGIQTTLLTLHMLPSRCHLRGSTLAPQGMKGLDRPSGPTAPGSPIPNTELPAHGDRELLSICLESNWASLAET